MKQFIGSRRVVIMQNPGECIEQAIFILKKDTTKNEDYIIEEAKKIVNEFAGKNGLARGRQELVRWVCYGLAAVAAIVSIGIFFYI